MYQHHRQQLFDKMKTNSAALFFSAPEVIRNADTTYPYRQDSYFWYLTQFNEPQATLILIKHQDSKHIILFNRPKNAQIEIWTGRRLGQEDALTKLNANKTFSYEELEHQLPYLLHDIETIYHAQGLYAYADRLIEKTLTQMRIDKQKWNVPTVQIDWRPIMDELRVKKSEKEITLLRRAGEIGANAHKQAMLMCKPNKYEYQLEAEIIYSYMQQGARATSFNTIVGSGKNGCILHYIENSACLHANDLVLIDAGCEYQGYASDITRTFPVNGKFTEEQKLIYELVLTAQNRAIELYKPGISIQQVNKEVIAILTSGLIELGILQGTTETAIEEKAYLPFYMHGLSHYVGLDVHDVGDYGKDKTRLLEMGMIITVEPGLYLNDNEHIPQKFKGIGVRIEDTILITETGNEILTSGAPKTVTEIEQLMSKNNSDTPVTLSP